jgi:tetratricopeptide (TPR) repeat protein
VEDRIETMKKDFREWWEIKGGKEAFAEEHKRYPNESDFRREQTKWINNYTDKFTRYNMAFVPKREQYGNLLTSWMLFPSVWSYLVFAVFFIFATVQLEKRWQWYILWGIVVGLALCGGIFVAILTGTSFFDHYDGERYMGMSLALVFLLGATAFAPRKDMVSTITSAVCFTGLILDMAINWFVNPGIFGAVTILSPVLFGAGAFAGTKIETRRKSKRELKQDVLNERARRVASRNPMAEMKAKTRSMIEAGFASAKLGQFDQAQRQLTQAMTQLLQEHPVDGALVKSLAERMTSPTLYIELMSNQWLEWGEIAKAKNSPEAAILLLKKGLSREKDKNFARRALYVLGETCITNKIEIEDGVKRLQKVIEMNGNDMIAKQAQKILDSIGK